jgi:hypothetical protein
MPLHPSRRPESFEHPSLPLDRPEVQPLIVSTYPPSPVYQYLFSERLRFARYQGDTFT